MNYKEDKISDHSKELKQHKTQLNLVSSNLDYIRTLVPADLDEKILQLEQEDATIMEQVRSNNGSISAWFAASQNFATADEMTHIQEQITRHEASIDLVNVNFDSLKSRFENQALEVEALRHVSYVFGPASEFRASIRISGAIIFGQGIIFGRLNCLSYSMLFENDQLINDKKYVETKKVPYSIKNRLKS